MPGLRCELAAKACHALQQANEHLTDKPPAYWTEPDGRGVVAVKRLMRLRQDVVPEGCITACGYASHRFRLLCTHLWRGTREKVAKKLLRMIRRLDPDNLSFPCGLAWTFLRICCKKTRHSLGTGVRSTGYVFARIGLAKSFCSNPPFCSGGSMIYRFADCILYTQLYTLHRAGQSTRLPPKVFEVLCYLIAHRDRVVSKQELCDQVWEGYAISDAALESCLRAVRITVGDSGQAQRIIQTQRGHGYRFVADVTVETSHSGTEERPSPSPVPPELLADPASTLLPSQPVAPPPPGSRSVARLCASCQHANDENAVFCAACGIRLRQLCAHCGQDVILPAAFCTACGQPLAAPSPPCPTPLPASQAERKSVTVLCCAVDTTAPRGARVDLDALHSLLLALHTLAQDVVRQYGGSSIL